jgi:hypothetical protein
MWFNDIADRCISDPTAETLAVNKLRPITSPPPTTIRTESTNLNPEAASDSAKASTRPNNNHGVHIQNIHAAGER